MKKHAGSVLTDVLTPCEDSYMNSNQPTEIKFTAKRASYWNNGNMRWTAISRDKARELIALGQAVDITATAI